MARHNPETPLPDATQEAYVQARARGMGPTQAAAAAGLERFRQVERQAAFAARLKVLTGEAVDGPGLSLEWMVVELKRTVVSARAANQFKNANEALSQLKELYEKHPELRGEAKGPAAAPAASGTREERRAAHRARLAVVPEAAHE